MLEYALRIFIQSSDPEIQNGVEPDKRQCLFPNEKNLSLFRGYSFSNCILECYLERAAGITGCIPWYFPRHQDSQLAACDPWKTTQFTQEISKIDQAGPSHKMRILYIKTHLSQKKIWRSLIG